MSLSTIVYDTLNLNVLVNMDGTLTLKHKKNKQEYTFTEEESMTLLEKLRSDQRYDFDQLLADYEVLLEFMIPLDDDRFLAEDFIAGEEDKELL